MDKKQLSQLYHITREIELIKNQINNMSCENVTDSVKGSDPCFPYVEHTILISGVDIDGYNRKVDRLKRKLQKRMDELIDIKVELNEYISTIKDSELRQIFTLRYIDNLTWQQIAIKMGGDESCDGSTERKKHDRFLKNSLNS